MGQLITSRILVLMLSAFFFSAETSAFQITRSVNIETSEERALETREGVLVREDELVPTTKPVSTPAHSFYQVPDNSFVLRSEEFLQLTFSRTIFYCTYLI